MPKSLVPNKFDTAGIYVEGKRSTFPVSRPVLSSGCAGILRPMGAPIPLFPGEKADLMVDLVIRSNTLVVPPLDGMYTDIFGIWVPHRIVWEHMPQFLGENDSTAWTQSTNYVYPSVDFKTITGTLQAMLSSANQLSDVDLGNFFLFPNYGLFRADAISPGSFYEQLKIRMIEARGYYFLWNHFFRDENYQRPVLFSKTDTGSSGEFGYILKPYKCQNSYGLAYALGPVTLEQGLPVNKAVLMPVCKFHDAYTSVLPQPQFGTGASLNIGLSGTAPVIGSTSFHDLINGAKFKDSLDTALYGTGAFAVDGSLGTSSSSTTIDKIAYKTNLVTDLSNVTGLGFTINQLREQVMYQRYLEALARGGRRVPEYYDVIYGVKNTDAMKDYPRMLSHQRYFLSVNQVVAAADSSGSGWSSHLGDTGAFSLTNLRNVPISEFEATEFGCLHIVYCVRADNRYSGNILPQFLRSSLLDEYNPYFDHIGDVGVPNYVVDCYNNTKGNFGYQEAWYDERDFSVGITAGALNKKYGSLKHWVLGETPSAGNSVCSPGWLVFDPIFLNDVFISSYETYPQFVFDGRIHGKIAGRISAHSIPGIVGRI